MITLLNDYILGRLLGLLEEKLGPPPAPYCWLLMGSEGRRDQTFRTDQDNGLMYRDPDSEAEAREAEEYFQVFADEAVKALVACGFPRCKGDVMASNPTWRRPYSAWQGYFDQWIRAAQPMDVLHATIFFDFRSGHGDESLGDRLRTHLLKTVAGQDVFFRLLAKDTLTSPPPLTFFRGFALEKNGPSKNRLDIKTKGLTPLVDFARLLSLRHGVKATNTLERLQLLGESGAVSREMQVQASQAYEFQMQIRLIHQQALYDDAQEPDNFIDPAALSDLDRSTLKEAFGVIQEIKSYLKEAFHLASA
jgi:CBS domain-containing protein